jgi:hypothetical protein
MSYLVLLWFDYGIVASLNLNMQLVLIQYANPTIAGITKIVVHIRYMNEFPSSTEIV